MKKLLLLLSLFWVVYAHAQVVQNWTSGLPTGGYNNHTIATDSQGNIYSVGTYDGTARDFDPGSGVFTMSSFSNSMYILKLDSSGNFIWAKEIGGPTNYAITSATAIAIDSLDNIYISGSTDKIVGFGNLDFDPGATIVNVTNPTSHYVMYILKLDSNGNHIWNAQFNNPANTSYDLDTIQSIKVDTSGNVYATGGYNGTVDFDPGSAVFNLTSGTTSLSTEIFILKLNSSGNLVWAKALQNNSTTTGSKVDKGYALDLDTSGNVYSVGYFWGGIDADPGTGIHNLVGYTSDNPVLSASNVLYVSKLDASGNFVWAYNLIGDHNLQFLPSLVVDGSNNIIVSGYMSGNTSALTDFDFGTNTAYLSSTSGPFVLKIDASANFIWVKSTASITTAINAQSYGTGMTLDAAGSIYTTGGIYNGTYDFDPSSGTSLVTPSNVDAYISKLDTNGNFVWATKVGGTGLEWGYSIAVSQSGKITVSGSTDTGFSKSAATVTGAGGFLASFTQPALSATQFELEKNISFYPNPTKGVLNIKATSLITKIAIYDMLGNEILTQNSNSETIDLSVFTSGIYFSKIYLENGVVATKKIIKE
ncbi:T9SS type A sorting domain-containing protein [Flavobacterium sp. N1994]|uniref:T9SS type A sorting domain-containing protein n=1 Tax=Flavobacterium sp. N1994 TaxID=2986827 RepID=UPI0022221D4C|nr:T9SS type A sorting domain-containing protein [Flavobacterium sp. N1994]